MRRSALPEVSKRSSFGREARPDRVLQRRHRSREPDCPRRSSLQAFRKQRSLTAIDPLNEAPPSDPPANRTRILSRESKQAMPFYTGWVNTCRTPTRARCPQLHQHRKCRRTSIGRSIRRRARSGRPQGTNAVGKRARMHRGRVRPAARTIDVRCLRSPSVSCHQGCISRYRLDRRAGTLKRLCDPHYLIGDVVDPLT